MRTDELMQRLAEIPDPVSRLSPPPIRVAAWFALAIPYVGLVVLVMSPRSELTVKFSDVGYLIEQGAALLTGLTAGLAAFATTVPGFDRTVLLLPAFPIPRSFAPLPV